MNIIRAALAVMLIVLATAATAQATPLANWRPKFLGCAYSSKQAQDFSAYWNEVTPENAGKWGSVEAVRGHMDWHALDKAYRFAKSQGFPFQMHVLVWGKQQPAWINRLPPAGQLRELKHWFAAVAQRYPDLDFVQVVNEPLQHPPDYAAALGGNGATGWEWVLESYRLARHYFPHAKLLINDYGVIDTPQNTRRYLGIINLLQRQHLLDGIGVQTHAFSTAGVPATTLRANLHTLATTGLPIYVTEMDVDGSTDAAQLKEYQRVFPVFWNDPAVKGMTVWGFRPGLWRNRQRAYLVRRDGSERPALQWLRRYVRGAKGPVK